MIKRAKTNTKMGKASFAARLLASAAVLTVLLATMPGNIAIAQNLALEEIVVTAERRIGNLQTTPVAVTAFTADRLENLQVEETLDLANNVPNLVLYTGVSNPGMVNLYMRGAGEQIGGLVTSESAVGLYVDNVYNARLSAANFDLVDIERIEVLRGPQGTLYGRNSMTGALKIVTREANGETWAKGSVGYGRFDEITVSAGGGFALVEDVVGMTISAQYRDQGDGWLENRATGKDRGVREVFSLRGKMSHFGSDTFKATLSGYYSDDDNDGLTPVAVNSVSLENQTGGVRTVQSPNPSDGFTEQYGGSLDMEWQIGDVSLQSVTAYIDVKDGFRFDLSGGVEVAPSTFLTFIDRTSVASSSQWSQELKLSGKSFDDRLDWIVGGFYFDEQADQQIDDVIFFNALVPTIIDQESESYAAFAQGTYQLTDRLSGTAGVRWTKDEKSLTGQIDTFFGSGIPALVDREDSWSVFTPRLGLDYQVSDDIFVYGSVSRGYRAGGYNGLTVANPTSFNTPFDPETVWAFELGSKADLADNRLRLNTAVFLNKFNDIQQSSTLGAGATAIQNVGKVDVYGVETEVTAIVTEALEIFAHMTVQDDSYKELDPRSAAATQGLGRLSHLSKLQTQLGFTYEHVLSDSGSIVLGSDYSHRSNYFSDATNQPINRSGKIDLVNGFVSYRADGGKWKATLSGKNITGNDYSKIGLVLAAPNGIRFVNEPTTWKFQIDVSL
ncbi:MAG: TonB-dependent receptor [Rhodospirillaceae bacterium]|nr:TonB-dependent receptor [Rhodospirillaceae bacterium]